MTTRRVGDNLNSFPMANSSDSTDTLNLDDDQLRRMGYEQVFNRSLSTLTSFSFCFTAVSVIPSLSGLFPTAMIQGGPVILVIGWIIGGLMSVLISASLGEICSTYPSAGSVYYWAGSLASDEWAPFASYVTGWFNSLGNAASDAFFAYAFASALSSVLTLNDPEGFPNGLSTELQVIFAIAVCILWTLSNVFQVSHIGWISTIGAFYQIATTFAIVISLLIQCPANVEILPLPKILSTWNNSTGFVSDEYVALIGMLTSLYALTGYEAAGHMAEETKGASKSSPWGILGTTLVSFIIGFLFIVGLLFGMGNVFDFVQSKATVDNIFATCGGQTYGLVLSVSLLIALFFAGKSSLTVTSRIIYAMARDGAFPGSNYLAYITKSTKVPLGAILITLVLNILFLLLNLVNTTAFIATTSLAVFGYQISYAVPLLLRATSGRHGFKRSDFNLGALGAPVALACGIWLLLTSTLFLFPTQNPITVSESHCR
jgi:amino acid transporter